MNLKEYKRSKISKLFNNTNLKGADIFSYDYGNIEIFDMHKCGGWIKLEKNMLYAIILNKLKNDLFSITLRYIILFYPPLTKLIFFNFFRW